MLGIAAVQLLEKLDLCGRESGGELRGRPGLRLELVADGARLRIRERGKRDTPGDGENQRHVHEILR